MVKGFPSRGIRFRTLFELAICGFCMTLPFEGVVGGPGLLSGTKLLGALVTVLAILKVASDRKDATRFLRNLIHPISFFALSFAAWSMVTVFWAPYVPWALVRVITFFGMCAIMQALALVDSGSVRRMWTYLLVATALSVPLGFVIPSPTELIAASNRFTSGGKDPNDYANLVVIINAVVLFGILAAGPREGSWKRLLLYPLILVGYVAIPMSMSRTAIVNGVVIILAALLVRKTRGAALTMAVAAGATFGLVGVLFPDIYSRITDRMVTLRLLGYEDTWAGRMDLWRAAVSVFWDHPLGGVGVGNFPFVSPQLSSSAWLMAARREDGGGAVAHNMFLSVLSETGLIGFILFMGLLVAAYRTGLRIAKRGEQMGYGLLFGLVGFTVAGLTLTWEYVKIPFVLFGSLLALQGGFHTSEKNSDSPHHT